MGTHYLHAVALVLDTQVGHMLPLLDYPEGIERQLVQVEGSGENDGRADTVWALVLKLGFVQGVLERLAVLALVALGQPARPGQAAPVLVALEAQDEVEAPDEQEQQHPEVVSVAQIHHLGGLPFPCLALFCLLSLSFHPYPSYPLCLCGHPYLCPVLGLFLFPENSGLELVIGQGERVSLFEGSSFWQEEHIFLLC